MTDDQYAALMAAMIRSRDDGSTCRMSPQESAVAVTALILADACRREGVVRMTGTGSLVSDAFANFVEALEHNP